MRDCGLESGRMWREGKILFYIIFFPYIFPPLPPFSISLSFQTLSLNFKLEGEFLNSSQNQIISHQPVNYQREYKITLPSNPASRVEEGEETKEGLDVGES